jgi:hypothetical protein
MEQDTIEWLLRGGVGPKMRKGARTGKILSRDDHDVTEGRGTKNKKKAVVDGVAVVSRVCAIAACASIRSGGKRWGER